MSRDLSDFGKACQNKFSSDMNFQLSDDIQRIVNYCSFTAFELRGILLSPYTLGPADSYQKNHFAFNSNVDNMVHFYFYKDCKYFFCNDENKDPVRYVIIFPAFHEEALLGRVRRMEKLKVFL